MIVPIASVGMGSFAHLTLRPLAEKEGVVMMFPQEMRPRASPLPDLPSVGLPSQLRQRRMQLASGLANVTANVVRHVKRASDRGQ